MYMYMYVLYMYLACCAMYVMSTIMVDTSVSFDSRTSVERREKGGVGKRKDGGDRHSVFL